MKKATQKKLNASFEKQALQHGEKEKKRKREKPHLVKQFPFTSSPFHPLTLSPLLPFLVLLLSFSITAQTGGGFNLSHNVIASGGGSRSADGSFSVDGTVGQALAGTISAGNSGTGNQYSLRGGFWAFQANPPTASGVSVSGRVFTNEGKGIIRRAMIVLTDTFTGEIRATKTSFDGSFRFDEVTVGRFYIIRAESKLFAFTPDNYAFDLLEERQGLDFMGERINKDEAVIPD